MPEGYSLHHVPLIENRSLTPEGEEETKAV